MKTMGMFCLVGGCIAMAFVSGCGKKPEVKVEPVRTIVFFGDSVTYGYGVDPDTQSFYSRIRNIMNTGMYGNVRTVNAGVSGDDTSEALARLAGDVTVHDPDIVVIAFGLNDCQNRTMTPEKFRDNITKMISSMPAKTTVILATSNSFLDTGQPVYERLNESLEPYMEEMRRIARERKLRLIDVHSIWKEHLKQDRMHVEQYYVDPTHPSAKGHGLIYEAYMNVLRKVLVQMRSAQ